MLLNFNLSQWPVGNFLKKTPFGWLICAWFAKIKMCWLWFCFLLPKWGCDVRMEWGYVMQNVAWCSSKGKSSVRVLSCSCHPLNMEKATKNMRQVSHQQDKAWRTDGWVRVGRCCLSLFQSWGLMEPTSCNLSWGFMSPCLGCWSYI